MFYFTLNLVTSLAIKLELNKLIIMEILKKWEKIDVRGDNYSPRTG